MKWYNKPTGDGCLQKVWAGGAMKQWHFCILYLYRCSNVQFGNTSFRKFLIHTTNQTLHSHSRYLSASLTVSQVYEHFFRLLYYFFTSCQHDVKLSWIESIAYHPHFGFSAANNLSICLMIIAALAIYQAWSCVGVGIGKCLTCSQIRHMVILFEF